jgi:hypothetical protein
MDNLPSALTGAWDFATAHPFVSAWLAVTTVWTLFTFNRRDA